MQIASPNQPGLLPEWSAQLTTKGGLKLNVRSAAPADEAELLGFLGQASPEDLRFRFLSSVGKVGHSFTEPLVNLDHDRNENLLAFDARDGRLVASAMIAADEPRQDAEVAVMVRSDMKGRGAGWAMLAHACDYARARGIQKVHSVELGDNRSAIALEEEMGFKASPCPDDMTLTVLTKTLNPA